MLKPPESRGMMLKYSVAVVKGKGSALDSCAVKIVLSV